MKKRHSVFVCSECGYRTPKWHGRCPGCGAWNSLSEEPSVPSRGMREIGGRFLSWTGEGGEGPAPIASVERDEVSRLSTGFSELDRVLGGGVVPGSLLLVGGDPGIGKSTLLLQILRRMGERAGPCLYVSAEESSRQLRLRAERLDALHPELFVLAEADTERIVSHAERLRPTVMVIDSIQAVFRPDLSSAPGSVSQVRECASQFLRFAKTQGIAVLLIGHVTKEGNLAGPRTLEHVTDVVLSFEGERHYAYRAVRAMKNRFGPAHELALFEMKADGLEQVLNPSELFLAQRPHSAPGSVVVAGMEGFRPLLVEVQALVARSPFAYPRRTVSGVDPQRVAFILAVLERRNGLALGGHDVYVKISGGLQLDDPAADLGIALAIASSFRDRPIGSSLVVFGEVGLGGEVRAVPRATARVEEAERMGFTRCILPRGNAGATGAAAGASMAASRALSQIGVETVSEALEGAMP